MTDFVTSLSTSVSDYVAQINVGTILITLVTAAVFGLLIAVTYMKTQRSKVYSQSMVLTIIILPVILSMIIIFVSDNFARAFSLAGTLSIVRFRSAPGEPKDIGYIFFAVAAGLACGVGQYVYGAIFVVLVCALMFVLYLVNFATPKATRKKLKITIPEDLDYENAFGDIFEKYTTDCKLMSVKTTDLGSLFELAYSVSMKADNTDKAFIDELRCRNGNLSIILSLAEAPL